MPSIVIPSIIMESTIRLSILLISPLIIRPPIIMMVSIVRVSVISIVHYPTCNHLVDHRCDSNHCINPLIDNHVANSNLTDNDHHSLVDPRLEIVTLANSYHLGNPHEVVSIVLESRLC